MGEKQKTGKKEIKDRKLVITMANLRISHASTHGARKPPGPIRGELDFLLITHSQDQIRGINSTFDSLIPKDEKLNI